MFVRRAAWWGVVCAIGLVLSGPAAAPGQGQGQKAPVPAVDTRDRAAVVALYREYYLAPVPADAWTGDAAAREPGTVAEDFLRATLRRVNYYRAMAGLPGDVVFESGRDAACQRAALMCALAGHISHAPPASWRGYTRAGAEAAANANLCVNWSADLGPGAVDAYLADDGAGNAAVAHRRWLLYPAAGVMGTGAVPTRNGAHPGANALWCRPTPIEFTAASAPAPAGRPPVTVAWPPAGFVPVSLVCRRWSFSCANADFGAARVRVVKNGRAVAVALERPVYQTSAQGRGQGVGLNTLAWTLPGNAVRRGADESYEVRVGPVVVGGAARDFAYTVTSIDPGSAGPPAR